MHYAILPIRTFILLVEQDVLLKPAAAKVADDELRKVGSPGKDSITIFQEQMAIRRIIFIHIDNFEFSTVLIIKNKVVYLVSIEVCSLYLIPTIFPVSPGSGDTARQHKAFFGLIVALKRY